MAETTIKANIWMVMKLLLHSQAQSAFATRSERERHNRNG